MFVLANFDLVWFVGPVLFKKTSKFLFMKISILFHKMQFDANLVAFS